MPQVQVQYVDRQVPRMQIQQQIVQVPRIETQAMERIEVTLSVASSPHQCHDYT